MRVNASDDWVQQLYVREFGNKLLSSDYYYDSNGNMVSVKRINYRDSEVSNMMEKLIQDDSLSKTRNIKPSYDFNIH